jgi:methionine transaminase
MRSKLPHIGTTIFSLMTERARELGAINLAQGFPDFDAPGKLKDLVAYHIAAGRNQYAPMIGVPELRQEIALMLQASYGLLPDAETEITITLGATEGIFSAILALVHPGDEVILFDPSYDSYAPAVVLAGGKPVRIGLQPPHFRVDWQQVKERLSAHTRLVVINTPHNPVATALSGADLEALADILDSSAAQVLSDEVYEHIVFDGARHAGILTHPELAARGVAVFSFGKTMHATGWRVGYTVAPRAITSEIRRIHQFNTFSIAAPLQYAIADFLRQVPEHNASLADFYQRKRDLFLGRLRDSRFIWTPASGSYFQLLDFTAISVASDVEFADRVLTEARVASIPITPFYEKPPKLALLRFCFAKNDATLEEAAERLCAL